MFHARSPGHRSHALVACAMVAALAGCRGRSPANIATAAKSGEWQPRFTVAPETTIIIEPLRSNGVPNYVVALDALAARRAIIFFGAQGVRRQGLGARGAKKI